MPTRKQRRRRAKDRRHEYEYVFVDDEGNEVEVDPEDVSTERAASRNGRVRETRRSNVRVQAPSWRRVVKRGLIFAPLMFVTVMLLDSRLTLPQVAVQTVFLLAIFLPFSYFMDSFMYRRYQRRTSEPAAKR
jgi:Flp pilus assembly protein TadB